MTRKKEWFSVKLTLVKEPKISYGVSVRSGVDIARVMRQFVADDPRETFCAIYLNTRNSVLAIHQISIGTCNATIVHPREVFLPAIHLSAACLVVCHNHPIGDCMPSQEDRKVTDRLKEAGKLLGIELLDHIVLGDTRFYSFAEEACFHYD